LLLLLYFPLTFVSRSLLLLLLMLNPRTAAAVVVLASLDKDELTKTADVANPEPDTLISPTAMHPLLLNQR
jgi:hypothetical protein